MGPRGHKELGTTEHSCTRSMSEEIRTSGDVPGSAFSQEYGPQILVLGLLGEFPVWLKPLGCFATK